MKGQAKSPSAGMPSVGGKEPSLRNSSGPEKPPSPGRARQRNGGPAKPARLETADRRIGISAGEKPRAAFNGRRSAGRAKPAGAGRSGAPDSDSSIRIAQLEGELAAAKEYLNSLLATTWASSGELHSLDRKIVASNQQLENTLEQLSSANEELQSANEELSTINEELRGRGLFLSRELDQTNIDLDNLVGSLDLGILLLDSNLRIRRFTATAEKMLGLVKADLGSQLSQIRLSLAIPHLKELVTEATEKRKPALVETKSQDGRRYEVQIRPLLSAENRPAGAVVALTNVSELVEMRENLREERRKRAGAEQAMRAGEERFRTVADSMPELICYIDAEHRYQFNNRSYERWYGIPAEHYKGRPVREVVGEALYSRILPYIKKALAGEAVSFEGYFQLRGLKNRYLHVDYIPQEAKNGPPSGFYAVIHDLTNMKEAEEKFRTVMQNAPQGTVVHDRQAKIVLVNSQAERMFGYAKDELIGQSVEVLMPERFRRVHLRQRAEYMNHPVARPMGRGIDLFGVRKDGTEFPVEVTLSPVETAEGPMVISGIVDITDRERLAQQTLWASILQERARMARDVHDTLAQGFTGIILNLEMALKECANLPVETKNRIARARDVARSSLEEARSSVLALSSPLPAANGLPDSLRELVEAAAANAGIRVNLSLQGESRPLGVAIETNLLRIAQQAVDNSLQHAQADEIRVVLSYGVKYVRLRIHDNGKGFDLNKVRGGLGLFSIQDRTQEIGGHYTLESQPGKGARIEVRVPISPRQPREVRQ